MLIENQVKKILELYEQLRQRMGVVVVGPSGSGKSTLWRLLRLALNRSGKNVKQYVMNPKAMPRTQLLGHIDIDTREWTDGVLTYSARQVRVVMTPFSWSDYLFVRRSHLFRIKSAISRPSSDVIIKADPRP